MKQETNNKEIDFGKFEKIIGVSFNNASLLRQAFTHRSFINENRHLNFEHNERLEFLGDAVLELVVTRFLFDKFPEKPEGELTAYRAALVNTNTISDAAHQLSMNDFLLLSRGESKDTGRARQYILANIFEALIGALYLDQGYDGAADFIAVNIFPRIDKVVEDRLWQDHKSHFQEQAQEHVGTTPSYRLVGEKGPDHNKLFVVGVYLRDDKIAEGKGKSKQEAEQEAAAQALSTKGWE